MTCPARPAPSGQAAPPTAPRRRRSRARFRRGEQQIDDISVFAGRPQPDGGQPPYSGLLNSGVNPEPGTDERAHKLFGITVVPNRHREVNIAGEAGSLHTDTARPPTNAQGAPRPRSSVTILLSAQPSPVTRPATCEVVRGSLPPGG